MAEGSVMEAGAWARRGREGPVHARPEVAQPCGGQRSTWPPYTLPHAAPNLLPAEVGCSWCAGDDLKVTSDAW